MNASETKRRWRSKLHVLASSLHHGLAMLGAGALLFALAGGLAHAPASHAEPDDESFSIASDPVQPVAHTPDELHMRLSAYLAKRYSVAQEPVERLVGATFHAAAHVGIDPLLLLAVMAVESRFNPIAGSVMGAKGLMQIIPRYHQRVLEEHGGEEAVLEPSVNIMVGARILKDYIERTGDLEAGLQFYNGALADESSQYAQKVMAEKDRLRQAVKAGTESRRAGRPA
jgi:hypothetical protein